MYRMTVLFLSVFLFFGTSVTLSASPRLENLHILVTSDLHSWFSTTLLYPRKKPSGLFHIAPIIQDRRTAGTLLLDGGDLISGSPYSYFKNFRSSNPTFQNLFFSLFKQLKYDAVAVGNHDLEFFPILKKHYLPASNFTWISANVIKNNQPYFSPYKIIQKGNLKIAIMGLTTAYSKMWISPTILDGMTIDSSLNSSKRWLTHIKKHENPDFIIGLFHLSLNAFRDEKAGKMSRISPEENVESILKNTSGINLVISGHDHRLHPYQTKGKLIYQNGIPVIRGGYWGNAVVELNLRLKKNNGKFEIFNMTHQVLFPDKNNGLEQHDQYEVEKKYRQFIFKKLPLRVTTHTRQDAQFCIDQLNAVANDQHDLDGSLLPKAKIRSKISINGIQQKDIIKWFPYLNKGVMIHLSQRDIDRLLNGKGDRRKTFKNIFLNIKNSGDLFSKRLKLGFFEKGRKKYRILISDYHFWGGSGWINTIFLNRTKKEIEKPKEGFLRDNLMDYLRKKKRLPRECFFLSYQD